MCIHDNNFMPTLRIINWRLTTEEKWGHGGAQCTHCLVYLRFILSLLFRLWIRRKICLLVFVWTTWIICVQSDSPSILTSIFLIIYLFKVWFWKFVNICLAILAAYFEILIFFIPFKKHMAIKTYFFQWEQKNNVCKLLRRRFSLKMKI